MRRILAKVQSHQQGRKGLARVRGKRTCYWMQERSFRFGLLKPFQVKNCDRVVLPLQSIRPQKIILCPDTIAFLEVVPSDKSDDIVIVWIQLKGTLKRAF